MGKLKPVYVDSETHKNIKKAAADRAESMGDFTKAAVVRELKTKQNENSDNAFPLLSALQK